MWSWEWVLIHEGRNPLLKDAILCVSVKPEGALSLLIRPAPFGSIRSFSFDSKSIIMTVAPRQKDREQCPRCRIDVDLNLRFIVRCPTFCVRWGLGNRVNFFSGSGLHSSASLALVIG